MEIGTLCVKLAGRDAGNTCVIVEEVDQTHVLIDGGVRRRKCNKLHLMPLTEKLDLKKGASHAEVKKIFLEKDLFVWETTPKKAGKKPEKKARHQTEKKTKSPKKKTEKPASKKEDTTDSKKASADKKDEKAPKKETKSKETKKEPAKSEKKEKKDSKESK